MNSLIHKRSFLRCLLRRILSQTGRAARMLAVLLALFGGVAGIAAGGGGGGNNNNPVPVVKDTTPDTDHGTGKDTDPVPDDDDHGTDDHDTGGDETIDDGTDDHDTGGVDTGDDGTDDHDTGGVDTGDDGTDDHDTGDDGTGGGGGTGDDGHAGHIDLPTTPAEITAFVAAVRGGVETHVHDASSAKFGEHTQVLDLVAPADATHIAIGHGSWFDPDNWHNGEVPGDDAKVVIPDGVWMEYDDQSDARLFTVRVDGQLDFATDVDSKMVVDTFVVAPNAILTIGSEDTPVEDDVNVEIVIANNGAIDTDWDPGLFSRGLISHGKTEIHGQIKDAHEKVIEDPMAGDTSLRFAEMPEGWEVGDKIVIAGTHYEGYQLDKPTKTKVYHEPEDEIRYITKIEGDQVFFDDPLVHDHDAPRADLHTSVANYSRNVTVKTEDSDEAEVYERGHVMMMHSDDVDIRYAAFEELGRTDKSEDLYGDTDGTEAPIAFDSNVAGRYGLHLHRTGVDDQNNPAYLEGNAVFGSPGWGVVHHDSHAVLNNNATYDTYGAGYVAETGNETGVWTDNIAIDAQGIGWGGAKGLNEPGSLNFGVSGDGFWFTGRMVEASDNIAASVNHGFIYFHRVTGKEGGKLPFDADLFEFSEALSFDDDASVKETPILVFEDNETIAARMGVHVVKSSPVQGHDVHSIFDGFTAWNVGQGANLQYTAHYTLKDFDLIAKDGTGGLSKPSSGIGFGKNTFDITIVDAEITGFASGINLKKGFSKNLKNSEGQEHGYTVINADLYDNKVDFENLTDEDTILDGPISAIDNPFVTLDGPLSYETPAGSNKPVIEISGTKTDSLGTHGFPDGPDNFNLGKDDVIRLLEENGYYSADDGNAYTVLNIYFSDTLSGDVYKQAELVKIDPSISLGVEGKAYADAKFNGEIKLSDLHAMTHDSVVQVRDNDTVEARTIEDFEQHSAIDTMMHDIQNAAAAAPADEPMTHEGEMMMATLSAGMPPLSEMFPDIHPDEDTSAFDLVENYEMELI